ncbi:MAG: LuxR family transcriptional regulator [Subtercola sp.]|nr:LuxR family transcriptional regulator [Subtercola sp.]
MCAGIIWRTSEELAGESDDVLGVLTGHQQRIAGYVADGYTSAEIGQMMHLSKKTIDFHVSNIVLRLGLKTRREISRVVRPSR